MSRRPIGDVALTNAERSRRRRIKARALRDAASPSVVVAVRANGSKPIQTNGSAPEATPAPPAGKPNPADYPRMLYHPDGRTTVVDTPEQHDRLKPDGWGTIPLAVHRQRPVTHHGVLGADNPFVWPMRRW
jgi:hypothetical protein